MSLQGSLNIALSGLRATTTSVDLSARNIANAQTPGYTRKTQLAEAQISNGVSVGVRSGNIQRDVDLFLQAQLRTEIGIGAQIDVRAQFLSRMDVMFGRPGEANALDTILNDFDTSLQALVTSPEDFSARGSVVNQAMTVADQLNRLSGEIQGLRQEAESGIADAVNEANVALTEIARLNTEIQARYDSTSGMADLEDQRDGYVDRLAQLLDVRVTEGERGSVRVFTSGGNLLVDAQPVTLGFDEHSGINATSLYNVDDSERGVGTLTMTSFGGAELDLFRHGTLHSGEIAALREMRDVTLVQAQAQLDELAHGLAMSMSQSSVPGTATTVGPQTGFDIDVSDLISGNNISVTVTQGGSPQTFTFIRVDDPTSLPLANDATANPNDTVIGIDFSGGLAGAAAAMDAALDAALGVDVDVTSPGANTLRILNDAGATVSIDSVDALVTPSALQDGGLQLAMFSDLNGSNQPYSGSFDGGSQKVGFASRIAVNPALISDNSLLVSYSTSPPTGSGDPARPLELLARFSETPFTFTPSTGIGSPSSPISTSISDFGHRIITFQGQQSEVAVRAQEAQSIVVGALNERYQADTGVDIDQELARLTELENVYAANARVMSVVQELIDILVRI
jgi:flagellar hook-associated protein 1 FlgK